MTTRQGQGPDPCLYILLYIAGNIDNRKGSKLSLFIDGCGAANLLASARKSEREVRIAATIDRQIGMRALIGGDQLRIVHLPFDPLRLRMDIDRHVLLLCFGNGREYVY